MKRLVLSFALIALVAAGPSVRASRSDRNVVGRPAFPRLSPLHSAPSSVPLSVLALVTAGVSLVNFSRRYGHR